MTLPLLDVRDLRVVFETRGGPVTAVDGLSFRVAPGQAVALVGESGSGKSVTAQAILGILPANARIAEGALVFATPGARGDPVDLARLPPEGADFRTVRGRHIAMIFQEPMTSLSPLHTIGDQVGEMLALHARLGAKECRERTIEMLRLVGFPEPARAWHAYPFELSGGLRQRAMIAMALICRPALLIADEPTTALDVTVQAQILKLIGDLRAELGMALLLITHDLGVVANMADAVVVMYRGQAMESGMLADIFADPRHPYLKGLLGAVPHFDMRPGERLKPLREIKRKPGHLLTGGQAAVPPPAAAAARTLLEVSNVSKSFVTRAGGGLLARRRTHLVRAVRDVSFRIEHGACFGLVGESGCGKSTLAKILLRALSPDSGRVVFYPDGRPLDIHALGAQALLAARRKIQYVFQDPFGALNPRMTIYDIVSEPLIIHGIGDGAHRRALVAELIERVGLERRHLGRHPHSFSGGQRQRIGIARALALKPDLLILDEPVSALDVSIQAEILNLLKDLQAELGLTYLFISHNLAVVDYMASRIAVMCAGRIVEEAPPSALFRRPLHPYTRALLAAVPYADPHRRLDFSALMDGRASDPHAWPEPFTDDGAGPAELVDVGCGHRVRTRTTDGGAGMGGDLVA